MTRIIIAIVLLSISTGLLLGSSNSPVIGVYITAIFGIIGIIIGLKSGNNKESSNSGCNYNFLGNLIIAFSIPLVISTYLGSYYRNIKPKNEVFLPWAATTPPTSIYEALDWISVSKILSENGYTENQIKSIYDLSIRIKSNNKNLENTSFDQSYSENSPYFKMLSPFLDERLSKNTKANRGPASDP